MGFERERQYSRGRDIQRNIQTGKPDLLIIRTGMDCGTVLHCTELRGNTVLNCEDAGMHCIALVDATSAALIHLLKARLQTSTTRPRLHNYVWTGSLHRPLFV